MVFTMPIHYSEQYWSRCWAPKRGLESQLKGAILGAGLGRRLDPLTAYQLPKPLFPLGGKVPIAEIWVRRLIGSGITDMSMNLCVMAEAIKHHFGAGDKFGINLTFVEEEIPSGTLGGVCKMALGSGTKLVASDMSLPAIPEFRGSTIIVPSGDIVANFGVELLEEMYGFHRKSGAAMTMVLTEVESARKKDFGTVILANPDKNPGPLSQSGRICDFREKDPNSPSCLSNASIYMIEVDLLRTVDHYRTEAKVGLDEPFYDFGKHLFPAVLGKLPYVQLPKGYVLWGLKFEGSWFDVGNKRDYLRVNRAVLDDEISLPLTYERLPWGYLGTNVEIDFSAVEIHSPVVIGNNCIIEPGTVLGPYAVIGDGWHVERRSVITNSVLWERYPYYAEGKHKITATHRRLVDRHEIRGVRIEESIIAGGCLEQDTIGQTVDIREDGHMAVLPIDYMPAEPRA